MSCLVSCTSGLFQYTISHVTESACVTPLGSDRLCLLVFYLVFGHEKGDKRHEAPGGRQDPSDMRHKARDRISARAKSATTATLQVALFLAVGVSQPCRKVLLRGSPPESREMGPELGPRLQGPLKQAAEKEQAKVVVLSSSADSKYLAPFLFQKPFYDLVQFRT